MDDTELLRLLNEYLEPTGDPNPEMTDIQIEWVRGNSKYGSRHMLEIHGITEKEVEQVLFEVPPYVEARRHPDFPNRTVFWGATRYDRWLIVVCEDWTDTGTRYLKPITAFEPQEGIKYWEKYQ